MTVKMGTRVFYCRNGNTDLSLGWEWDMVYSYRNGNESVGIGMGHSLFL